MDHELEMVVREIIGRDPSATSELMGQVLRDTFDQLLDGQHTGRYRWEQLFKTEKTHAGTLVEINLQRAFRFPDGDVLDFSIGGVEVDCKYSQSLGGWMIPPEAHGHLCMVVSASDEDGQWSCGVVRASEEHLSAGRNRDNKRTLNATGRAAIRWLFHHHPLPPNVYLQLDPQTVAYILDPDVSGQERVNRLFEYGQGRIIGRGAVATAGQQDDFMKRARGNGGARSTLQPKGIVIFGHEHREFVRALQLPVPDKGELVSARLVQVDGFSGRPAVTIDGDIWAVARPGDPVQQAPELPRAPSRQ